MDKLKTNYVKGDQETASGVNNITSTINEIITETNNQYQSTMEKLTKTFVDNQPFYAADMNTFTSKVNEVIDVLEGGGDDTKWEIGDIVIYDNVENKKIKSSRAGFNTTKYPETRYTAIGVIAFVMADGSARMVSLVNMNTTTPDTGSVSAQSIYWGYNNADVPGLTNYPKAATIDHTTGEVVGAAGTSYVPGNGDQFGGALSLDGVRVYYNESGDFLPSPYNADGTLNSAFTQSSVTIGPLYCWSRMSGSSTYYMYTDTETPTSATTLWCGSEGRPQYSVVKNYGNQSKIGQNNKVAMMLGSILDESVFDGGVTAFTANFTSVADSTYEETIILANSDLNGKSNCATILSSVTVENWQSISELPNNSNEGNYPIATTTWRFHTTGTSQGDWYCPAAGEIAMVMSNFGTVQHTLKTLKPLVSVPVAYLSARNYYWSSSEISSSGAWCYSSYGGYLSGNDKNYSGYCVRALCLVPALSH